MHIGFGAPTSMLLLVKVASCRTTIVVSVVLRRVVFAHFVSSLLLKFVLRCASSCL